MTITETQTFTLMDGTTVEHTYPRIARGWTSAAKLSTPTGDIHLVVDTEHGLQAAMEAHPTATDISYYNGWGGVTTRTRAQVLRPEPTGPVVFTARRLPQA